MADGFPKVVLVCLLAAMPASVYGTTDRIWVGASDSGIYTGELDTGSGTLGNLRKVVDGVEAHYIVKHPSQPIIYAAIRTDGPSRIVAYRAAGNGDLVPFSELGSRPHGVSHINTSADGRYLGVAYYRTGIAGVYRLDAAGRIASILAEVQHEGRSVNAEKQEAPHPHWAGFSADSRYLYVPDLGTDHVWVYEILDDSLRLVQKMAAEPGSGPRHMVLHPDLDVAYVSEEFAARVTSYALDRQSGKLSHGERMPPAPEATGKPLHTVSDVRLHPSGRFLYLVNRGFDRVSVFSIDPDAGRLTSVQREPVRGSISRNIAFDATGRWALVAGHDSNTLALFEVDAETGALSYTRQIEAVPTPMAIAIGTGAGYSVREDCDGADRCFERIQDALAAVEQAGGDDWARIDVAAGDYSEKVDVRRARVRIVGAGADVTRLHFDAVAQTAGKYHRDGWGTPGSATLTIDADQVIVEGLTVENTFDYLSNDALPDDDPGKLVHSQGVALLLDIHSDRVHLDNVSLEAYQDTLFANGGRAYITNSFISGNVDFIFGNGQLLIEDSTIESRTRSRSFGPGEIQSFIAAPSTQLSQAVGIVFHRSRLTRETGVPDHSVTLGRPWHPTTDFADGRYADPNAVGQALYIDCFMDAHIHEQHWSSMHGTARDGTKTDMFHPQDSRFYESGSHGPGAAHVDIGIRWTDAPSIDEIYRVMFMDWPAMANRILD